MKTHGDPGWQSFPSYLDTVVPRFLEFLKQRQLAITVFVVGQDAALDKNREALAMIPAAGHEIGNHSFNHEPWLHLYTHTQIDGELARTEDALLSSTGQKPVGFRGPGFSLSNDVLRVLVSRGYEYDCSTFPTFLGPLARLYYFCTAKLDAQAKNERKKLFGTMSEGLRPLAPYVWNMTEGNLLEIPVTTMPLFRVPIHVSYLLYLDQFSRTLALTYWHTALTMLRTFGVAPSLLLHPLDFMGVEDRTGLDFFPAMRRSSESKIELIAQVLDSMQSHYQVGTMREHAKAISTAHAQNRAVPTLTYA